MRAQGYPLAKAQAYERLRNPFMLNDLAMAPLLLDRRDVYTRLRSIGVPTPHNAFLSRDGWRGTEPSAQTLVEHDDYIEVNGEVRDAFRSISGVRPSLRSPPRPPPRHPYSPLCDARKVIEKPFLEKPVDAEDHNIYIYYPMSAGGGSKRLFRKVNNRSSEFYPDDNALRGHDPTRSFIYETFLHTQGTDVKVYTCGPVYAHSEARKSPVVDGKVMRDTAGKEVRYPVILSLEEKRIATKVAGEGARALADSASDSETREIGLSLRCASRSSRACAASTSCACAAARVSCAT